MQDFIYECFEGRNQSIQSYESYYREDCDGNFDIPGIINIKLFIFLGVLLIILLELLVNAEEVLLEEAIRIKFLDILLSLVLSGILENVGYRWLGGRLGGPIKPPHLWLWGEDHDFFREELGQDYLFCGPLLKEVDNVFYDKVERRSFGGHKDVNALVDLESLPPVELLIEHGVNTFVDPSGLVE